MKTYTDEDFYEEDEELAIKKGECRKALRTCPELKRLFDVHFTFGDYSVSDDVWGMITSGSTNVSKLLRVMDMSIKDITPEMLGKITALKGISCCDMVLEATIRHPETGEEIEMIEEITDLAEFYDEFGMDGAGDIFRSLKRGLIELTTELHRINSNKVQWVNEWFETNRLGVHNYLIKHGYTTQADIEKLEQSMAKQTSRFHKQQVERDFQDRQWIKYYAKKFPFEGLDTLNMIKNTFEHGKYNDFSLSIEEIDKFQSVSKSLPDLG